MARLPEADVLVASRVTPSMAAAASRSDVVAGDVGGGDQGQRRPVRRG
jgi:hypothetical protein